MYWTRSAAFDECLTLYGRFRRTESRTRHTNAQIYNV